MRPASGTEAEIERAAARSCRPAAAGIDGRRRAGRARVGLCVVFAVSGAAFSSFVARIPAMQRSLAVSDALLVTGLLGMAAGAIVMLLAGGPLISKFGSRAATGIGAVIMCSGLPLMSFPSAPAVFVAALALFGAGKRLQDLAMNAQAARVERESGRRTFASFHAFYNIGGIVGSGVDALLGAYGVAVRAHFLAAGVVLLATALIAVTGSLLPGSDVDRKRNGVALPSKTLLPLGVMTFCGLLTEGIVNCSGAKYLTEIAHSSDTVSSSGYICFCAAMIPARLAADRVAARHGVVEFIRATCCVSALGFVVVIAIPVPIVGVIGFAVIGLGIAGVVPLALSSAGHKDPLSPDRAVTAVASCGYLALLASPGLVGLLSIFGDLHLPLICVGALAVVVAMLASSLSASKNHPQGATVGEEPVLHST
jgi:MFS family permease